MNLARQELPGMLGRRRVSQGRCPRETGDQTPGSGLSTGHACKTL